MIQVELQRLGILLAVAVGHGELWSLCILGSEAPTPREACLLMGWTEISNIGPEPISSFLSQPVRSSRG